MNQPDRTARAASMVATIVASEWGQRLLLAMLSVAAFAAGITGDFVFDDKNAIVGHPVVQGIAPLFDAFKLSFWGESLSSIPPSYRPVATLSFAIDHRLFGGGPLAFHLTSLLCHVALVLAGWTFARRCLPPAAAWLAMAFFAVMPTHAETAVSLVGRADTLAALFSVLALLALSPTVVDGEVTPWPRLLLAMLTFAAGLLCKESVAVLPVIVGLFAEHRRRRADRPPSRSRLHAPTTALLLVLAAYLMFRLKLQPGAFSYVAPTDVVAGTAWWVKAAYGIELLARYARLVVVPVGLCTGRTYAEVARPAGVSPALLIGAALFAVAGWAAWRSYRRGGFPFVAAAVVAWTVVAGVIFAMPESMADRFLLLPSFFICLALGPWLLLAWQRGTWCRALLLAAVSAEVVLSNVQAATWSDEGHLLAHAVRACPSSVHNHFRYAEYLSRTGQVDEAVWHYAVFTSGRHAFPYAWSHPAAAEEASVPVDQRLRDVHRLLRSDLDEATWHARFVAYLRSLGRPREARRAASLRGSAP